MTYYGRIRTNTYVIKDKLGSGGEGEVYTIEGNSDYVAKVYYDRIFNSPDKSREELKEKLLTMLDQPVNPYLLDEKGNQVLTVAWPKDILVDANGTLHGYIMPKVDSKYHIFAASRERERATLYPRYTWMTAVRIAYNLSLAVRVVHDADAVIGDFNSNNIMIDDKGHVTLIDTDSYNITNKKTGKTYKCKVGVQEMLAPELQGKNLAKPTSIFTKQTDAFALAIHIFNLIMNNCHPFGCTGMNSPHSSSSSNPLVKNITNGYCPYVSGGTGTSPSAPDFSFLPTQVQTLFKRTFSYNVNNALSTSTINNRPSAHEWQNALVQIVKDDTATCKHNRFHKYPKHNKTCPWCAIDNRRKLPAPSPNKARTIGKSNNSTQSNPSKQTVKQSPPFDDVWPLWVMCIMAGIILSPFMANPVAEMVSEIVNQQVTTESIAVILGILGAISGAGIAYYFQNDYFTSTKRGLWLFLSPLSAIGGILILAAIGICIFIIVAIIEITVALLQLAIGIAIVIGFFAALFSG